MEHQPQEHHHSSSETPPRQSLTSATTTNTSVSLSSLTSRSDRSSCVLSTEEKENFGAAAVSETRASLSDLTAVLKSGEEVEVVGGLSMRDTISNDEARKEKRNLMSASAERGGLEQQMMIDTGQEKEAAIASQHEESLTGQVDSSSQAPVRYCKVCDSPQAAGMYFGVLACIPCKAFFIRCLTDIENGIHMACVSREKPDQCEISLETRTVCKTCRFQKCLRVGMARKERPASISNEDGRQLCAVCGDIANGIHFGAVTCEGCKKFYRRAMNEAHSYSCKNIEQCDITARTRNSCRSCRWQKCLKVGMSKKAIRMGRPSKFAQLQLPYKEPFVLPNQENPTDTTAMHPPPPPPPPPSVPSSRHSELLKPSTHEPSSSELLSTGHIVTGGQESSIYPPSKPSSKQSGFHINRGRERSADRGSHHSGFHRDGSSRDRSLNAASKQGSGVLYNRERSGEHCMDTDTTTNYNPSYPRDNSQERTSADITTVKQASFSRDENRPHLTAGNIPKHPGDQKDDSHSRLPFTVSSHAALHQTNNQESWLPSELKHVGFHRDRPFDSISKDTSPSRSQPSSRLANVANPYGSPAPGQIPSLRGMTASSEASGSIPPSHALRMPLDLLHDNVTTKPLPQNANQLTKPSRYMPDARKYLPPKHQNQGYRSTAGSQQQYVHDQPHSSFVLPQFSRSLSDPRSEIENTFEKHQHMPQYFAAGTSLNRSVSSDDTPKTSSHGERSIVVATSTAASVGNYPCSMASMPSIPSGQTDAATSILQRIIKEEDVNDCAEYGREVVDSASKASVSPTELISGDLDMDEDTFDIQMADIPQILNFVKPSLLLGPDAIKTEPIETEAAYSGQLPPDNTMETFDAMTRKRKFADPSLEIPVHDPCRSDNRVAHQSSGIDGGTFFQTTGNNGSTSRKVKNVSASSQYDEHHPSSSSLAQPNIGENFISAFLNFVRVIQDLPPGTDVSRMNAQDLLMNLRSRQQDVGTAGGGDQGQPDLQGISSSKTQLQEIYRALSSLIAAPPAASLASSVSSRADSAVAASTTPSSYTSATHPFFTQTAASSYDSAQGIAGVAHSSAQQPTKAFTQWRSPGASLPTQPLGPRSSVMTSSQDQFFCLTPNKSTSGGISPTSLKLSSGNFGARFRSPANVNVASSGQSQRNVTLGYPPPAVLSEGIENTSTNTSSSLFDKDPPVSAYHHQQQQALFSLPGTQDSSSQQSHQRSSASASLASASSYQSSTDNNTTNYPGEKTDYLLPDYNARDEPFIPQQEKKKIQHAVDEVKGGSMSEAGYRHGDCSDPEQSSSEGRRSAGVLNPSSDAVNPGEAVSFIIQKMMENLLSAGRKTDIKSDTSPSQELPTMQPTCGASRAPSFPLPPPSGANSFTPPQLPPQPIGSSECAGGSGQPDSNPVEAGNEDQNEAVGMTLDLPPWEPPRVDYDYWLRAKLPDPNIFLSESHNQYIHTLLSAYKDFIEDMEGTLLYLHTETRKFFKKYGELVPPLEILRKELALFAQSTVSFCCRIPEFSSLCKDDQMVLFRVGGNQSRVLTSAVHWYNKEAREYTIFYPLKPHPGRMDYQFYLKGKEFCQTVQENLEMDLVEESLMQATLYYATDYQGLKDTKLISKLRWQALECFRAYTTAKYGSSNTKIEDLFSVMPQLRQMGLLEHKLGQNLSLLKDQSYPIPDPTAVKQDFPLPDLVHDVIMPPKPDIGNDS